MSKQTSEDNKEPETTDSKFSIDSLRKHSKKLFGITEATFDGVVSEFTEVELTEEYSVKQMDEKVQTWLERSVN